MHTYTLACKRTHTYSHICTHTHTYTCMHIYVHIHTPNTCPQTSGASIQPTCTPTCSCCCTHLTTALAEPLSQLVTTVLPPCSRLVLSCCSLTICGNWLGLERHVTHTTVEPRSQGHAITAKFPRTHKYSKVPEDTNTSMRVTTVTAMRCGGEESRKRSRLFNVHLDTGREGGAKWQNVPGRKNTERRVTFRNNCFSY